MKTTFEIPDSLLRKVKATAAGKGQTMTAFVTAALEEKLAHDDEMVSGKPWMAFAGIFANQRAESERILSRVQEGCEGIDSRDWR